MGVVKGRVFTKNDEPLSSQPCGCDPGHQTHSVLGYHCEHYPNCAWGKSEKADTTIVAAAKLQGIHDSGMRETFASGAMRDPSTGKLKWSRIFFGPMARRWAQHLTTAEAKYPDAAPGVPNFSLISSVEEKLRYKESALRHFMSWYHEETNEDHASAVFFNINGVEIIKAKERGDHIDGIAYTKPDLGSVLRNEEDYIA